MSTAVKELIISVIILIVIVGFIIGISLLIYRGSEVIYNDGTCIECGGHYEYFEGVGGRIKSYIYRCDNCGHMIEIYTLMNDAD